MKKVKLIKNHYNHIIFNIKMLFCLPSMSCHLLSYFWHRLRLAVLMFCQLCYCRLTRYLARNGSTNLQELLFQLFKGGLHLGHLPGQWSLRGVLLIRHLHGVATFRCWGCMMPGNTKGGKYHCTVNLLLDWLGISCVTTDNFCFYLQNGPIQTSQTWGQGYNVSSPFSILWWVYGFDVMFFAAKLPSLPESRTFNVLPLSRVEHLKVSLLG